MSFLSFLWRLTPAIPRNFFSIDHQQYDPKTVLTISWNAEKYTIDFPGRILGSIKLGELREICKDLTGIPLGGLTLFLGGATMKDDNAPLSCFGIKPNSRVVVDGYKPTDEDIKQMTTNGDPEEYALILRIQNSLQKTQEFVAEHMHKYEQDVEAYIQSKPAPFSFDAMPAPRKRLQDTHGMLSENLLQSLLKLDGVTCQPDFEVARVKRREAVKATQKLLDQIDGSNAKVKKTDVKL
ncbi:hypothetical protein BGZ94_000907 [Podila epigama]|nr:hypothetical protein BGZ94_000907 [Podila epigama]